MISRRKITANLRDETICGTSLSPAYPEIVRCKTEGTILRLGSLAGSDSCGTLTASAIAGLVWCGV